MGLVAVPRPKDFEPVVFVGFESAHFSLPADAVVFVFLLVAGLPRLPWVLGVALALTDLVEWVVERPVTEAKAVTSLLVTIILS